MVALAVLFLAIGLAAVASLEVALLFVSHGQDPELGGLRRHGQQDFALLLQVYLVQLDFLFEKGVLVERGFYFGSEGEGISHQDLLLGKKSL